MAITFVDATEDGGTSNTSSVTISKPTGLAVGDLMVSFIVLNDDSCTGPSGWTKYDDDVSTSEHFRSQVWYKVATSSDVSASSFKWTDTAGSNSPMWGAIAAYRGVKTTGIFNDSSQSSFTTNGAKSVTGPSVTTTATCRILHFRCVRCSGLSGSISIPTYTGSGSERFEVGNHGSSTSYSGVLYDADSDTAPGTISGISITESGDTPSTSFSRTLALTTLITDISVNAGRATAAIEGQDPTAEYGIAVDAGVASATADVLDPHVLSGRVVHPISATVTTSCPDIGRRAHPATVEVEATVQTAHAYYGAPAYRTYRIPPDRPLNLGPR